MNPLPTPVVSRPSSPTSLSPTGKPIAYMPTRLHPDSITLAHQLFDVITPSDPRFDQWPRLADVAIVRTGEITRDEMSRCERLKIVTRNGVGYDMIPIDICKEKGIRVTNQPGSNAKSVAELVLGLALGVSRRVVELDRRLRRGEKLPNIDWMATSLDGKVVGLVGMGDIARETAKKFVGAFESPILIYSPTSSPLKWTTRDPSGLPAIPHERVSTLEELLKRSDVVSLHCPLFDSNRDMMGERQFALMKDAAILINTARGGLINERQLVKALKSKTIAGAGLDVFCTEPASRQVDVYDELFDLENVVVLPHAGGGTAEVQLESCNLAVRAAYSYLKGEGVMGCNIIC
ncbi:hypothetical protein T439DRAFT_315477 [Meredithblackwellia eburnea MCA 4105]